ncbi:MAG: hypothetical protein JRD49_11300 [Deltaproteobacteria bacterium]|nr:hypothetical protein [Deltaproteobacteria bacterium]MBW2632664.1 hypothetical protein [Deltaproteobacteria bacterium]MBW2678140.1 hypothetical protein [Deltaproteobacteria bacterium]
MSLHSNFSMVARPRSLPLLTKYRKKDEKTFLALAENIHSGRTFKREERMLWRCRNCGYVHAGSEAPSKCPACVRPSGHFELFCENW